MEKRQDNFLIRFFKGVIIALGFILPGVSGGVLAAILGIYERLLGFMAHIRQNFKRDFLYFLPVGIGGIVGIGVLSQPLDYLFTLSSHCLMGLCGNNFWDLADFDQRINFTD